MNALSAIVHGISPYAADLLVASIWQGVLLTGAVALCLRVFRELTPAGELTPAVRSAVWTGVLLLLLCLPGLPLLLARQSHRAAGVLHAQPAWGLLLLSLWIVASACRALRLGAGAVRLRGVARRAHVVDPGPALAPLLRRGRRAELCTSTEVDRPSVLGFLRPRILLPPGLLETLSSSELAQIALHEMEHLRRRDDWVNLVQQIILVLLPLSPALLWLDRRLCQERELACDDGVLRSHRARTAYAACLVKLAEDSMLRRGVSLALSALGTRDRESELVRRVRRILSGSETATASAPGRWMAGLALSLAVALSGLLTVGSPDLISFEQTAPPSAEAVLPVTAARSVILPVSGRPTRVLPPFRPVLASAVMTDRVPATRRIDAAAVRRVPARSRHPAKTPRWQSFPPRRSEVEPRVVLTRFEITQPVYAAVPWRGGWLILQL